MQKILFTEFAELKQGDGKGPQFFAGKAYWLSVDQAVRWKREGVAIDAPINMVAENERGNAPVRPEHIKIKRVRGGLYHVYGQDDYRFTQEAVNAGEAEKLRQRIIAGEVKMTVAASETATPAAAPVIEQPAPSPVVVDPPSAAEPAPEIPAGDVEPKQSLGFFHAGEDHFDS